MFSSFFCRLLIFSKLNYSIEHFRISIKVSNNFEPDHSTVPDRGLNCAQRLPVDDTGTELMFIWLFSSLPIHGVQRRMISVEIFSYF